METAGIGQYREFLIILGTAGLVIPLFVRLGISSILGFLLVGFLLSRDVLGSFTSAFPFLQALVITDEEAVSSLGELGVVFLLFLIGLELSFERLVTMKPWISPPPNPSSSAQLFRCHPPPSSSSSIPMTNAWAPNRAGPALPSCFSRILR